MRKRTLMLISMLFIIFGAFPTLAQEDEIAGLSTNIVAEMLLGIVIVGLILIIGVLVNGIIQQNKEISSLISVEQFKEITTQAMQSGLNLFEASLDKLEVSAPMTETKIDDFLLRAGRIAINPAIHLLESFGYEVVHPDSKNAKKTVIQETAG